MGVAAPRKLGLLAGVFVATSVAQASQTSQTKESSSLRIRASQLASSAWTALSLGEPDALDAAVLLLVVAAHRVGASE